MPPQLDPREWTLEHRLGWEHWTVRGPSTHAEIVKVAPLSRAEAAEQRVDELERELRDAGERFQTLSACVEEDPRYLAIKRIAEQSEAKLATAVEALKGVIDAYDAWSVNAYPGDGGSRRATEAWFAEAQRVENAIEQARVLSEIEQGDTK